MSADPTSDDTLPASDAHAATAAATAPPTAPGEALPASLPGLRIDAVLGRGGMGEVLLAHDAQFGREIAVKRMRAANASDDATARFLREARIQARLDHPAIVPVHALGADRDGRPFFTMKRLAGTTLGELLARPDANASRPRLLRALVDVCLAIDFAHERGVVHRDLKPANIMLGDFGEVYVLDWGVARVLAEDAGAAPDSLGGDLTDGATQVGAVIGTPGYMAPEQVRGEPAGREADVYALGVILFEILAGSTLHPRGEAALTATLAPGDTSPARRAPDHDVAPELDGACQRATALDRTARPTARELADTLQRFLDGDRDVALRKTLAAQHLAAAQRTGTDDLDRVEALREAGRALALDPANTAAADLVTRLMLEPPREGNPEVEAAVARVEVELSRRQGRSASIVMGVFALAGIPMGLFGIRNWPWAIALELVMIAYAGTAIRDTVQPSHRLALIGAVGSAIVLALMSRLFGPFVLGPAVACAVTISLSSFPLLSRRAPLVIALMIAGLVAPFVLEAAGLWTGTWDVVDGALVSRSVIFELRNPSSISLLIAIQVAMVFATGAFGRHLSIDRHRALAQVEAQAWRLRQLLPAPRAL